MSAFQSAIVKVLRAVLVADELIIVLKKYSNNNDLYWQIPNASKSSDDKIIV